MLQNLYQAALPVPPWPALHQPRAPRQAPDLNLLLDMPRSPGVHTLPTKWDEHDAVTHSPARPAPRAARRPSVMRCSSVGGGAARLRCDDEAHAEQHLRHGHHMRLAALPREHARQAHQRDAHLRRALPTG